MKHKVFFTAGYDDIDSLSRELRSDVLIQDSDGNFYNPLFITIDRIKSEFENDKFCYVDDNIVFLHQVTKDNILKSIEELYKWQFDKRWRPINNEMLENFFYPKENWVIFILDF